MSDSEEERNTLAAAEEQAAQSALHENIQRKGNNSYYYAHGKKIEGPAWDGKEQPRLLSVTTEKTVVITTPKLNTLDSFSWLDGKKNVKVYVDFDGADQIHDDNIFLTINDRTLELKFDKDGKWHYLSIGPLYDEVESVSHKKKSDKFVLTLIKATESGWYQLKKT